MKTRRFGQRCGDFHKTSDVNAFDYKPQPGCDIDACIVECVGAAVGANVTVTIRDFNGVDVVITPTTTTEEAHAKWQASMDANAEAYRNSPEGKRRAQEREEEKVAEQREVDRLLAKLDGYGPPTGGQTSELTVALAQWLAEFAPHADDIAVSYNLKALADKLEAFGYTENAHTDPSDKHGEWSRNMMGRYIIGQGIACLRKGMPPHPGLTEKFVSEMMKMTF